MNRFDGNDMEEQDAHYTCIQLVDSVMEWSEEANSQDFLSQEFYAAFGAQWRFH